MNLVFLLYSRITTIDLLFTMTLPLPEFRKLLGPLAERLTEEEIE